MSPLLDSDPIQSALHQAALQLQDHYAAEDGTLYRLDDLHRVLAHWLVLSAEALAEDAVFHTIEGDRAYAFNRRAFDQLLTKIHPLESSQVFPTSQTIAA